MYQSALSLSRDDLDLDEPGCSSLVWFMTRSEMMRIPVDGRPRPRGKVVDAAELGGDRQEVTYVIAPSCSGEG